MRSKVNQFIDEFGINAFNLIFDTVQGYKEPNSKVQVHTKEYTNKFEFNGLLTYYPKGLGNGQEAIDIIYSCTIQDSFIIDDYNANPDRCHRYKTKSAIRLRPLAEYDSNAEYIRNMFDTHERNGFHDILLRNYNMDMAYNQSEKTQKKYKAIFDKWNIEVATEIIPEEVNQ